MPEKLSKRRLPLLARHPRIDDIEDIQKLIRDSSYELHDAPQVQQVIQKDSQVVGYASLKLFADVMMILDSKLSTRDKAESLALLIETAQHEALKLESDYIFMCTPDKKYAELVEKHFGFQFMKNHYFLRKKVS